MNRAQSLFWMLMGSGVLLAALLIGASARLLLLTVDKAASPTWPGVHWCLAIISGSAALDEFLLLGFLAVLPLLLVLASASLVHQVLATRHLLRALSAVPRSAPDPAHATMIAGLGLAGRVDFAAAREPFAFCHGLVRPRICVSTGLVELLTNVELEAVLIHEGHHLRSYDPLRMWLARAVGQALFFLPIASHLHHGFMAAKELAADAAAIRTQGSTYPLASALYRLVTCRPCQAAPALAIAGVVEDINTRIKFLLDPRTEPQFSLSVRAIATSILMPLLAIFVITHPGMAEITAHVHAVAAESRAYCVI